MGKGAKGDILFHEREYPPLTPKRKVRIGSLDLEEVHSLRNGSACVAALLRSPPLVLLDDLVCSYYPLLRSRWRLCCLTDAAHPLRVPLCVSCAGAA